MPTAKKKTAKKRTSRRSVSDLVGEDVKSQPFLLGQLTPARGTRSGSKVTAAKLKKNLATLGITPTVEHKALLDAVNRVDIRTKAPIAKLPREIRASLQGLRKSRRRFHGTKLSLGYFRGTALRSKCADKFCYMSSRLVRRRTALPFTSANKALLEKLGALMGDPGPAVQPDSPIPAGFTYAGQFIDHDITLDVSSSLDVATDATTIHNMRTPALDLDNVYGQGPALDPFLYDFPSSGNDTAIKMKLGTNLDSGPGGSAGTGSMQIHTDFDVPRTLPPAHTALIGDPRNDENLIIVQFQHAMLRLHNAVVDMLLLAGFPGDIFIEAKRIVTHHYQWAVVHDFLTRVCGSAAVRDALANVQARIGSGFCMPVEFSVAAYRFGHSMIRDHYWLNFNFTNASLGEVFAFNRNPHLPVRSNWVVDFNAFFETGVSVPVFNRARKIDSALANGLMSLPDLSGLMAMLAKRNLLRSLALGLPSGQGLARQLRVPRLTESQLLAGLPAAEVAVLQSSSKLLLRRTPLWYYILREAAVTQNGDHLGRLGAKIVAETFVRMLKRDPDSFLNTGTTFSPSLPSATAGDFTFADLVRFAGVIQT